MFVGGETACDVIESTISSTDDGELSPEGGQDQEQPEDAEIFITQDAEQDTEELNSSHLSDLAELSVSAEMETQEQESAIQETNHL